MMKFLIPLLVSIPALAQERPYKIIIIADEDSVTRANEFKDYLSKKPPFNKMEGKLDLSIVTMSKSDMDCKNSNPDSPRIISCNNSKLFAKQSETNAHMALAFTSNGSGGAGGSIPVASADYPIQTMFHEMLHTYGLDDEYDYSESEKTVYCRNPDSSGNMAYFRDVPPYADDPAARTKHSNDIPWFGRIPEFNLITTGQNLGSSEPSQHRGTQMAGLYRGGSCDSARLPGWRPYLNSIMRGYLDDTIYPLYEDIIVQNIESSLGRRLNLPPAVADCDKLDFVTSLKKVSQLSSDSTDILLKVNAMTNQHKHSDGHDHGKPKKKKLK